jgi:hypothetical protein
MVASDVGRDALALLADLFGGAAAGSSSFARGFVQGTGHPDDPYRFALAPELPNVAVWFSPDGLAPRLFAAPENLRDWRPGFDGLSPAALAAALAAEAALARDVRELVEGRDIEAGLIALAQRWLGGDGRIVARRSPPPASRSERSASAQSSSFFSSMWCVDRPHARDHGACGARRRRIAGGVQRAASTSLRQVCRGDVRSAGTGHRRLVRAGTRADCRAATSTTDGTPEQAARLGACSTLATVSNDIALLRSPAPATRHASRPRPSLRCETCCCSARRFRPSRSPR